MMMLMLARYIREASIAPPRPVKEDTDPSSAPFNRGRPGQVVERPQGYYLYDDNTIQQRSADRKTTQYAFFTRDRTDDIISRRRREIVTLEKAIRDGGISGVPQTSVGRSQ